MGKPMGIGFYGRHATDSFWSEDVWLPPNTTWADVTPGPGKAVTYTDHRHVWLLIPLAFVLLAIRFIIDKYVYTPFGRALGIKDGINKKAAPNPALEAAYRAYPSSKKICDLAKQLDMSERQVARWLRRRRAQDKPSPLVKFGEDLWRSTFFFYNCCYGLYILWDKDWLWEFDYCFIGYPHQGITNDVWWYYMVTCAYYWSQTMSIFWEVRRKDFWQMLMHHLLTIVMMSFSWVCNFHRLGTLVVVSLESSEIILEAAKAAKHASYQKLCECLFVVSALVWMATRMVYYPFHIIWSTSVRPPTLIATFPAFHMLKYTLYILMVLNILWTRMIAQIAYNRFMKGQRKGDVRSSNSEMSDSSNSDHSTTDKIDDKTSCYKKTSVYPQLRLR